MEILGIIIFIVCLVVAFKAGKIYGLYISSLVSNAIIIDILLSMGMSKEAAIEKIKQYWGDKNKLRMR